MANAGGQLTTVDGTQGKEFGMLKRKCQALSQKLAELGVEADQHRAVVDTLKVLDADRKCFRLVGGVLVERKVGDTLPELQETHAGILNAVNLLKAQLTESEDKLHTMAARLSAEEAEKAAEKAAEET